MCPSEVPKYPLVKITCPNKTPVRNFDILNPISQKKLADQFPGIVKYLGIQIAPAITVTLASRAHEQCVVGLDRLVKIKMVVLIRQLKGL